VGLQEGLGLGLGLEVEGWRGVTLVMPSLSLTSILAFVQTLARRILQDCSTSSKKGWNRVSYPPTHAPLLPTRFFPTHAFLLFHPPPSSFPPTYPLSVGIATWTGMFTQNVFRHMSTKMATLRGISSDIMGKICGWDSMQVQQEHYTHLCNEQLDTALRIRFGLPPRRLLDQILAPYYRNHGFDISRVRGIPLGDTTPRLLFAARAWKSLQTGEEPPSSGSSLLDTLAYLTSTCQKSERPVAQQPLQAFLAQPVLGAAAALGAHASAVPYTAGGILPVALEATGAAATGLALQYYIGAYTTSPGTALAYLPFLAALHAALCFFLPYLLGSWHSNVGHVVCWVVSICFTSMVPYFILGACTLSYPPLPPPPLSLPNIGGLPSDPTLRRRVLEEALRLTTLELGSGGENKGEENAMEEEEEEEGEGGATAAAAAAAARQPRPTPCLPPLWHQELGQSLTHLTQQHTQHLISTVTAETLAAVPPAQRALIATLASSLQSALSQVAGGVAPVVQPHQPAQPIVQFDLPAQYVEGGVVLKLERGNWVGIYKLYHEGVTLVGGEKTPPLSSYHDPQDERGRQWKTAECKFWACKYKTMVWFMDLLVNEYMRRGQSKAVAVENAGKAFYYRFRGDKNTASSFCVAQQNAAKKGALAIRLEEWEQGGGEEGEGE
jgi:hypothetical protein